VENLAMVGAGRKPQQIVFLEKEERKREKRARREETLSVEQKCSKRQPSGIGSAASVSLVLLALLIARVKPWSRGINFFPSA